MRQQYDNDYQNLNQAQKQAVDNIDGPMLVIAGPGTGKTQLLSLRIANILINTDINPDNILCLTFSDAAVHAMQKRLIDIIGNNAYSITISTYHSFGSALIQQYPEYFPNLLEFQPSDKISQYNILRQVLDSLSYDNKLKKEYYLDGIHKFIANAKKAKLSPDDIIKIAKSNKAFVSVITPEIRIMTNDLARVSKKSIASFRQLLKIGQQIDSNDKFITGTNTIKLEHLWNESLIESLELYDQSGKTEAITSWKKNWLEKDYLNQYIPKGLALIQTMLDSAEIYQNYQINLRDAKLYDYDDMILNALEALNKTPELRYNLQERYLYLLLDEYQDTNEAQFNLIKQLTDNPINEGRPNVLAVGDDDQAIFSFQGADYSHMLKFTAHYRNVEIIVLTDNYRSTQGILNLSEKIAHNITTRLIDNFPKLTKSLKAQNSNLQRQEDIHRIQFETFIEEYDFVAAKVADLINNQNYSPNEIAIIAPKHKYLQDLLPYLSSYEIAVNYINKEDIILDPVIQEIITMSRLITALQNNEINTSNCLWPQVLTFDYFNIATSLLFSIVEALHSDHSPITTHLLNNPTTRPIALFFIRLSQLAVNSSYELIIDYILGMEALNLHEGNIPIYQSPFKQYYLSCLDIPKDSSHLSWSILSKLLTLKKQIKTYQRAQQKFITMKDFLDFIDNAIASRIKIADDDIFNLKTSGVQLLTAFMSKGQEFQTVFLIDCLDDVWGPKSRSSNKDLPLMQNLKYINYANNSLDERLRLFYVSLTRAKQSLYLTDYNIDQQGKQKATLSYFNEREEKGNTKNPIISPLLPSRNQQVQIKLYSKNEKDNLKNRYLEIEYHWTNKLISEINSSADLTQKLQHKLENFQLSATNLSKFLNITYAGPESFLIESLIGFPTALTLESIYGSVIHKTLEWFIKELNFKGSLPNDLQVIDYYRRHLRQYNISDYQAEQLINRGKKTLLNFIKERRSTINQQKAVVEYNFKNDGIFLANAHLTGKIDKIIINETLNTATIVDYKTSKSHNKWETKLQDYFNKYQLYFYKYLVEHSTKFKKYKVSDAYLEFIEPDEHNNLNELHITYNNKEEEHFKNLVEVVWDHVSNFYFPKINNLYPNNIKGIKAFEADLINKII